MASSFSSWRLYIEGKSDFNSSATEKAIWCWSVTSWILANLSIREVATLATNWIKDRPEGLKLQNLALATITGPALRSYPKNTTVDVQHALNKCESLGAQGNNWSFTGTHRQLQMIFSPHMAVVRRHFLPNMQFECCLILQVTLGGNFNIFAASGESTAWVLLWKPRSRPIGVWVCPVAQCKFFSTAFDPRAWTPGCVREGKFRTSAPADYTWERRRKIIFHWWSWSSPLVHKVHNLRQGPLGIPPWWPPAPSHTGGRERVGTWNTLRERFHPRPSPLEPQLIPIPMGDGEDDDDQPP